MRLVRSDETTLVRHDADLLRAHDDRSRLAMCLLTAGQYLATIRAPLRWAGSKRKSVAVLAGRMPSAISTYIEPFAGSACLAFATQAQRRVLGDLNPRLIEFYQVLKTSPTELFALYAALEPTTERYYEIRTEFNLGGYPLERASQFLYLNRLCFNGIYRVNAKGAFNVPWGGKRLAKPLTLDELVRASAALSNTDLMCDDFETVVSHGLSEGAFIYLDPPYARDEERVFREYHQESFSTADWPRLLDTLDRIDQAGAYFLLSYAGDSSLVEELTKWNVGHLDVTRNVGGFRASRRKYREFIATNYVVANG
jgi:DNA adenine methylase